MSQDPFSVALSDNGRFKIIAPASTVQFQPKFEVNGNPCTPKVESSNIESGKHWVDMTQLGTIVVIQQPEGQKCAVVGGIMALRMSKLGAKAVVVSGRVRDIDELQAVGMPIWARDKSTVGTSAEAKPYAVQVPIHVGELEIKPGDIVVCDPTNGVVVIPKELLDDVLRIMPTLEQNDAKVKEAVENGLSVAEAFARFR